MTKDDTRRAVSLAGRTPPDQSDVSRDTPPTPRLSPSSTPYEEVPPDLPETLVAEYRSVLSELDWLAAALSPNAPPAGFEGPAPPAGGAPSPERSPPASAEAVAAPAESLPPRTADRHLPRPSRSPDFWGAPSPYLDERLAAARAASIAVSHEFVRMERRAHALRGTVERLQGELDDASAELAFLRSSAAFDGESEDGLDPPERPARFELAATVGPEARPRTSTDPEPRRADAPVFEAFTADRYDATVRQAQSRHGRVAAATVLLAVLISTGLLALTYFAHEPMPVWWLAVLPLVWLIPVPFFIASFRGTHRLLRQKRLELTEAA
ncbi:MAG TPA: hypothetical protein VGP88_09100 [Thermoplasmata archaeon]|nr:hypothetical protein [Thermoplasmata archaeon]